MRGVALVLVVLMAAVCSVLAVDQENSELRNEYEVYKAKFGKHYATEEEDRLHMKLYFQNKEAVVEHNKRFEKGLETWEAGINQFSDMTEEEKKKYHGVILPNPK